MGPNAYLLDIEGTTSPIDFVYQCLFPYARARLDEFVANGGVTAEEAKNLAAERDDLAPEDIAGHLHYLMDLDRKSPTLKAIQGRIWEQGYLSGEILGEVYPDVIPAIRKWRSLGAKVAIYSSGSVLAQKLLFGHLAIGDFTPELDGFFDTSMGGKREPGSYLAIAEALGFAPSDIVFVSDIAEEVAAASAAGMAVRHIWRPEDGRPRPSDVGIPIISSFADV